MAKPKIYKFVAWFHMTNKMSLDDMFKVTEAIENKITYKKEFELNGSGFGAGLRDITFQGKSKSLSKLKKRISAIEKEYKVIVHIQNNTPYG